MKASNEMVLAESMVCRECVTLPVNQLMYVPLGNQNCPVICSIHGLGTTWFLDEINTCPWLTSFFQQITQHPFRHLDERIGHFWTPKCHPCICISTRRPTGPTGIFGHQDNANIWMDKWIEDTLLKPSLEEQVWKILGWWIVDFKEPFPQNDGIYSESRQNSQQK